MLETKHMNMAPEGHKKALQGLASLKKTSDPAKTSVDIVKPQTGWDSVEKKTVQKAANWRTKVVTDWNKKDLVLSFFGAYYNKYGRRLSVNVPFPDCYQSVAEIEQLLYKQLDIEPTVPLLKQYFDYCFDNWTNEIIARKTGRLTMRDLAKEKYILAFCKTIRSAVQATKTEPVKEITIPKVEKQPADLMKEFAAAFKIHAGFFVSNFGLLIPVNYLILHKGKSKEDAIAYVQKVFTKANKENQSVMIATTKKWRYPTALPVTSLEIFSEGETVELADIGVLDCLLQKNEDK